VGAVKYIDWSSKHNILIHNPDGSYSPMDEPYFVSEKVCEGVWKILSAGDYCYLIEGSAKAIAIDTGYGAGNIREYMQSLTPRPLSEVINTHDHFDHTANNAYFDRAYMSAETAKLATIPFASFAGIRFPADYEHVIVKEGYIFDLGDKTLEVFSIPDHAVGSIAMLDRADRLLFTGDEFMPMPMGKTLNVSVARFAGYLEKLEAHRSEFDRICGGNGVLDATLIDSYRDCAAYILGGHEGDCVETGSRPKMPPVPGVKGHIVYDRQLPHEGDGGAGMMGDDLVDKRIMRYAGVSIVYGTERQDS
jgi:glyoxylase-like metal-dependent hydrolase (beta-lactamase superfamily II)